MAYRRGDEDQSTWNPRTPTQQERDDWMRDPRNHVTPGLQEVPLERGPTNHHREISRQPAPPRPEKRKPTPTSIVYH